MDPQQRAQIEAEVRHKAVKRAGMKLGFYWHAAIFGLVNAGLAGINVTTSPQYLWFLWPLCGWAVGLALHGFAAASGGGMHERMIEAEVQRELAKRGLV